MLLGLALPQDPTAVCVLGLESPLYTYTNGLAVASALSTTTLTLRTAKHQRPQRHALRSLHLASPWWKGIHGGNVGFDPG